MSRPKKKGLEYFPFDVDIFEDDKLFDVQNQYGPLGEIIYIRLLCFVYKNGYYYRFDSLDKLAAMMIRSIGNKWTRDKKTVIEVISYLAKCNLFSSELMRNNILTSRSIQKRYLSATERRQSKIDEYNLLEKSENQEGLINAPQKPISVAETSIIATETSKNDNDNQQSKVKESKVKESKVVVEIPTLNCVYRVTEQQLQQQYTDIEVIKCLRRIESYMRTHTDKRKSNKYTGEAYIPAWIANDLANGLYPREKIKEYGGVYDLEAYEKVDPFADMD